MIQLIKQFIFNKTKNKGEKVRIPFSARIGDGSIFEGYNAVGKLSFFCGKMGMFSYMGDNVVFMGECGRYTSISSNVHVINGRHPIKTDFVSTSPVFYAKAPHFGYSFVNEQLYEEYVFANSESKASVIIGNDCWIGFGVSIIGGLTIGDGAVVLANATVTKNVPPYAIVGGVPAKIVGYRYDDEKIRKLIESKWWDKDIDWIKRNVHLFSNIEDFLHNIDSTT